MDLNPHKVRTTTWCFETASEEQIIHHQQQQPLASFDSINLPSYHNQSSRTPASSNQVLLASSSSFVGVEEYINRFHQQQEEGRIALNINRNSNTELLVVQENAEEEEQEEELGPLKEMIYKIAAMQPVDIDPLTIRKPKRRNVRISEDPQSVAARQRRERISEKIRILQRLVPGATKMDTASMLDEAIRYVKFLKRQIRLLQPSANPTPPQFANEDYIGMLF